MIEKVLTLIKPKQENWHGTILCEEPCCYKDIIKQWKRIKR